MTKRPVNVPSSSVPRGTSYIPIFSQTDLTQLAAQAGISTENPSEKLFNMAFTEFLQFLPDDPPSKHRDWAKRVRDQSRKLLDLLDEDPDAPRPLREVVNDAEEEHDEQEHVDEEYTEEEEQPAVEEEPPTYDPNKSVRAGRLSQIIGRYHLRVTHEP